MLAEGADQAEIYHLLGGQIWENHGLFFNGKVLCELWC